MNTVYWVKEAGPRRSGLRDASRLTARMAFCVAMICLGCAAAAAGKEDDDQPGACTLTARAVYRACRLDAGNDYFIAVGNCENLSDQNERAKCKSEAKAALKEGAEECRAQLEARDDLCDAFGEAPYDPPIDPSMFVDPAQIGQSVTPNPYFPLVRGTTWIYKDKDETETVSVTGKTKVILGVTCAVIRDVVKEDGGVTENTVDWYAQDVQGNVWYFGESTQELEDGIIVTTAGSFIAGVDGAKPGLIMKAHPAIGDVYRQEFSLNNAEDAAKVLSLTGSTTVPAASCDHTCLVTKDFTPLEPGVFERKFYAPGVGSILEVNQKSGKRLELVEFKNRP